MFSRDFRGAQPCAMTTGDLLTLSGLRSNKTCRVKTCRLLKTGLQKWKNKAHIQRMHSSISYYVQVWHETQVFGVKFIEQGKSIRAGPGFIRCQKDKKKKKKKSWSRKTFLDRKFVVV